MALMRHFMNRAILALLMFASVSMADFSDSQYAEQPEVLARITAAAQKHGNPLRSSADGRTSYYLRSAEYIGPCEASFGTVHIARLFFTRSGLRNRDISGFPASGHAFIVFVDREFTVRGFWTVDHTLGRLSVSGTKLLLEGNRFSITPNSQPAATSSWMAPFRYRLNGNDRNA
jgi:hypothetical protein